MAFNGKQVKTRQVAIVAAGVISPLGLTVPDTLQALQTGRDCVAPVTTFPVDRCRCKTAGQVDDTALRGSLDLKANGKKGLHRASYMMMAASTQLATADPKFLPELAIIGTTSGGMSHGENYYRALQNGTTLRNAPEWIANYPPQKPLLDALEAREISVPCQVIAHGWASGTNAIGHSFECIRNGHYRRVLAGGYDAISELVFVGFDSLQAATPEKCRPFDKERTGMVLGEGAALFALEEMESARARNATILAEITGYGISTDNHHLTQPNPTGVGARAAMAAALESAGIPAAEVDYINAHGTATPFNDSAEGKAIAELFGAGTAVSSTKGMMGHSLGAAGAIEAAFCLLALQHDFLPPNINFREPDPGLALNIVANESRSASVRTVLSNSFGFGGANASIILRKASV